MASKKKRSVKHSAKSAEVRKLEKPGDSVEGFFTGLQVKDLYSPKTKDTSPTRMYHFREEDSGESFIVFGAAMLDDNMDVVCMEETKKMLEDEGGVEDFRGQYVRIERGEDKTTNSGNTLGTYEVTVLE